MRIRQLRALVVRLSGLFGRERRDRELAEELESHLQMHIEDNLRAGLTAGEVRRQALIKLGGLGPTKESDPDRVVMIVSTNAAIAWGATETLCLYRTSLTGASRTASLKTLRRLTPMVLAA